MEKDTSFILKTANGKEERIEPRHIEKFHPTFNLQKELEKVKYHFPLTELLKKPTYKAKVSQCMHPSTPTPSHDSLNIQEERSMVIFWPDVEELDSSTALFYVTLVMHDHLLHNCMFYSRVSHKPHAIISNGTTGLEVHQIMQGRVLL